METCRGDHEVTEEMFPVRQAEGPDHKSPLWTSVLGQ